MTTTFFAPPEAFRGHSVELPTDEAQHALRTLRKAPGDQIVVVDGKGGWHTVELTHADRDRAAGRVVESRRDVGEPSYDLTIGLALLKNRSRYETFLEKATELGVRRVVPLLTSRTEKKGFRRGRAQRILVAAMKQCGRSRLVELDEPTTLEAALASDQAELSLLCHESLEVPQAFSDVLRSRTAPSISVWIGPEGGFEPQEVERAVARGARAVSLGPRRLRAETAALAAAGGVLVLREHATASSI